MKELFEILVSAVPHGPIAPPFAATVHEVVCLELPAGLEAEVAMKAFVGESIEVRWERSVLGLKVSNEGSRFSKPPLLTAVFDEMALQGALVERRQIRIVGSVKTRIELVEAHSQTSKARIQK
ncbi:hypothetical protein ASF36_24765 [Methylobacterium sp. Leaf90]|nr:hypothetical protein ASF36_24765 [Methylobacterium sp. Leaf90]